MKRVPSSRMAVLVLITVLAAFAVHQTTTRAYEHIGGFSAISEIVSTASVVSIAAIKTLKFTIAAGDKVTMDIMLLKVANGGMTARAAKDAIDATMTTAASATKNSMKGWVDEAVKAAAKAADAAAPAVSPGFKVGAQVQNTLPAVFLLKNLKDVAVRVDVNGVVLMDEFIKAIDEAAVSVDDIIAKVTARATDTGFTQAIKESTLSQLKAMKANGAAPGKAYDAASVAKVSTTAEFVAAAKVSGKGALATVKPEAQILSDFTAMFTTAAARAQNISKLEELLKAAKIDKTGFTDIGTYGALRASFLVGGKIDDASAPFVKAFEKMISKLGLDTGFGCKPALKEVAKTWAKRAAAIAVAVGGAYYVGSQIWNDADKIDNLNGSGGNGGGGSGDGGDGSQCDLACSMQDLAKDPVKLVPFALALLVCFGLSCCAVVVFFVMQKKK